MFSSGINSTGLVVDNRVSPVGGEVRGMVKGVLDDDSVKSQGL
jgi:hypothetical protein